MSIQTMCPECRVRFSVADQSVGKKIRCGKCQAVFVARAAKAALRQEDDEEDDEEDEITATAIRPRSRGVTAGPGRKTPAPAAGRGRRDEEDDRPAPVAPRSNVPWLVGGAVLCVAMLTGGGIVIALLMRPEDRPQAAAPTPAVPGPPAQVVQPGPGPKPPVQVVSNKPVTEPAKPSPEPVKAVTPDPVKEPAVARIPGVLSAEAKIAVKRATVYIRVTRASGLSSGSGFFGDAGNPNIILTNAHVVGMLSPDSPPPNKVEIFINSGQPDEKMHTARILGVDRESDLAVLEIGVTAGLPRALRVKPADKLQELDKVFVSGFPLGEQLGKEISVRESSVSSLRKKEGLLDKIQVNGGMDEGNSGGPVVDDLGHVVGVAVSGYPGRQINFAIPGDRVHNILNGRVSRVSLGLPFKEGEKVGSPVLLEMIDPRNKVKEIGVEVWTGDRPAGKVLRRAAPASGAPRSSRATRGGSGSPSPTPAAAGRARSSGRSCPRARCTGCSRGGCARPGRRAGARPRSTRCPARPSSASRPPCSPVTRAPTASNCR
jgi:predicted Zn finger-like uncharacterized protein